MISTRAADPTQARRFRAAYGQHRAAEGRGAGGVDELLALPFLRRGPFAKSWRVRARTFERFVTAVLDVRAAEVRGRMVQVADLGAGNGWLCYRLALHGHAAIAVDIRDDTGDGLAAASIYADHLPTMFPRIVGSFEAVPLADRSCDIVVFNAALHYALDLRAALTEAARIVMGGGRIVILDSPFYAREADGSAMVEEKQRAASALFGALADDLMALPLIEFLTPVRLADASPATVMAWRRHRVRYPLWYEARPLLAWLRRKRAPSRFDLWEASVQ